MPMSEAMRKVSSVKHLPLFPLPLVLMPNELLPLHIFEEKYRKLLKDVVKNGNIFGITRFEPEEPFAEKPELGSVGCVAEIREVEEMPDGRSNIVTVGTVRYKLIDYVDAGEPYLIGDVDYFEDADDDEARLKEISDEVFGYFDRIARAAFKMSGNRGTFPEIERTDHESFSFLAAAAFNFENDLKTRLIEMTSTIERLEKLRTIFIKTVDQMESSADIHKVAQTNGHSTKKLDL